MTIFIAALLLGFIFSAAPGPVFAETLRQSISGGFRSALAVQFGSLVGDATWAILGLAGVGLLLQLEFLRIPLGIAGVLYLTYLAYDSWRSASQTINLQTNATNTKALRSGALLSLTNPQNIAYWAAIGSALGSLGIPDPTITDYAIYFSGFMVASILWCFICASLVTLLIHKLKPSWTNITYKICALAFLLLAFGALRDLLGYNIKPNAANISSPSYIESH